MENEILNYVKQKALKNYFNSNHSFFDLFPEEDFDFSKSNYTHFLYFDKSEGEAFLSDFLLFVKTFYNKEVFSFDNYYSVLNEFKKYLESNNVFFYTKTKMGLDIANDNNDSLLIRLKSLFGETHFVGDGEKVAFNEKVITKNSFNYDFFNYLLKKLDGYNNYKYIVEPLLENDLTMIKNYFKGFPFEKKLPFFLDTSKPYAKDYKKIVLEKIVASNPDRVYAISKDSNVITLVIVNIEKNVAHLEILCDSEYYDSELDDPINFICKHLFSTYDINKISTINQNKGIAFSGINSTLVIAQFKPDYSLGGDSGYSKIRYEISLDSFAESQVHIENSIIKFNY